VTKHALATLHVHDGVATLLLDDAKRSLQCGNQLSSLRDVLAVAAGSLRVLFERR
jgi:hypothetical protein